MSSSIFSIGGDDESQQQSGAQILPEKQQQDGSKRQLSQNNRFEKGAKGQKVLRAIWDTGSSITTTSRLSSSAAGTSSDSTSKAETNNGKAKKSKETNKSQKIEGKNVTIGNIKLDTLSDALDYCRHLAHTQLERAKQETAPMNECIFGDAHAKNIIVTLLPDQCVRRLFIEVCSQNGALKRIRPLFGAPPYHFLKPEDAGILRAEGFANKRTNMSYGKVNEAAAYSQFGSGHFVDEYFRQYRVVAHTELNDNDKLPCNIENTEVYEHIFMNVRVPKRSRTDRIELSKNAEKRRALVFPHVGEVINVSYSDTLQKVLGKTSGIFESKVLVKSIVPRSDGASTASMVAVRVN